MSLRTRTYQGQADLQAMTELVQAHPTINPHVVDLPYRLAAPDLQSGANVQVWQDETGQCVGWAVWQQPWACLDYAIYPAAEGVDEQIILWALERFAQLAGARHPEHRLHYSVEANQFDSGRIALLQRYQFIANDWHELHLTRSLQAPIPMPRLPSGFRLRPFAGEHEVPAYVALHRAAFGSTNMTVEWRQRILALPEYRADLDLVIEAPDGRLAAFCIGWFNPKLQQAQVEPLGVHPDFQAISLGRSILCAELEQMRAQGAETALVDVYNDNISARNLYEQAGGFQVAYHILRYYRPF